MIWDIEIEKYTMLCKSFLFLSFRQQIARVFIQKDPCTSAVFFQLMNLDFAFLKMTFVFPFLNGSLTEYKSVDSLFSFALKILFNCC